MNDSNLEKILLIRRLPRLRAAVGAAAVASVLALTSGCVVAVRPAPVATVYASEPAEVVVNEDPPAPYAEVIGVAPGPGFLWVGGYWHWNGRWVWYRGHYARPPHSGAVWVRSRYVVRGGSRIYVRGYWH